MIYGRMMRVANLFHMFSISSLVGPGFLVLSFPSRTRRVFRPHKGSIDTVHSFDGFLPSQLCRRFSACIQASLSSRPPSPSFFKSIVVRRLYDKEANNVVYVSYSSKLDTGSDGNKSRFKSSLCALHIE